MSLSNKYRIAILFSVISLLSFSLHSQSVHHINVWGGGGYSSLLHGIEQTKVPGGFGYEVGIGYQLDIDRFMLNVGAEFQHINSKTKLNDYHTGYLFQYTDPLISIEEGYHMTYGYDFLTYEEKHSVGYVNIPLLAGVRFNRYYALLGAKVGINIFSNYKVQNTMLRVSADDPQFIIPMEGIGHGTGEQAFTSNGKMNFGLNVVPSVEFGVYLNEWLPRGMTQLSNRSQTPLTYRVGVFVDYGVLNLNKSSANLPMVNEPKNNDPSNISLNPLAESYLAKDKRFGNLLAGVKLTVQFQMSKKKKPKTIPPTPTFYARVVDEYTSEPLDAEVSLNLTSGRKQEVFRQTTDSEGMVSQAELKAGRYMLTSTSEGYNTYKKSIRHSKEDTLLIPMRPTPVFYVYVYDEETKENLRAEVTLVPAGAPGSKPALKAETEEGSGFLSGHNIRTGRYQMSVTKEGYIYHQEIINYTKIDTFHVALKAIKKDVVVVLNELFFALNEATILPESGPALEDLYQFLNNNPNVNIKITGHTDSTGRLEYNMKLSEERAKAVYDDLISRGINAERMSYEGKGPHEPVSTNETEEGRAQNRRVEFKIQ